MGDYYVIRNKPASDSAAEWNVAIIQDEDQAWRTMNYLVLTGRDRGLSYLILEHVHTDGMGIIISTVILGEAAVGSGKRWA